MLLSCYHWEDQDGVRKQAWKHEGGEQGDPLMPLLFSLAVHDVLSAVKEQMLPGEELFAFLVDVCILCAQERCRILYDLLADGLFRQARRAYGTKLESAHQTFKCSARGLES